MAWSSLASNKVSIIEVDEKQNYLEFKGVQITKGTLESYYSNQYISHL